MWIRSISLSYVSMAIALLTQLIQTVSGQHSPSANEGPSGVHSDLASILQSTPVGQQELLSNALRIIHSMESSPTCNRLAALNLINSCKSLEHSPNDSKKNPDEVLDYVKSEYAARLAVCEIIGATVTPPRECAMLIPSSNACVKQRFKSLFQWHEPKPTDELCYPDASQAQFERCLRTLDGRPQWWISYSNARQNAVVMCQASRDAIEKEEKLFLYQSLADATTDITSALANSIKEAQEKLNEQMDFIESLRKSQAQAVEEVQKGHAETAFRMNQIVTDIHQTFQSFMGMVSQTWSSAASQADDLSESLSHSKESLREVHEGLQNLFSEAARASSRHSDMVDIQNQQLALNHESALAVQQALDTVSANQLHTLSQAIGMLRNDVHMSAKLMEEMYERQTHVDERLFTLNGAFDTLEATATNLQTTIDETTGTVQVISSFLRPGAWPGAFGALFLLLVGLWFTNKRAAGVFMTISGIIYLLYTIPILEWLSPFALSELRISRLCIFLATAIASLAVFAVIGMLAVMVGRSYFFYFQDEYGRRGIIPKLELPQ